MTLRIPEAERAGERVRPIRARPWALLRGFGRPVSAASRSGRHTAASRRAGAFRRTFLVCVALVALAAAACGSDDPVTVSETTDPQAPEAPVESEESPTTSTAAADPPETAGADSAVAAGPGDVPDLQMVDVHTDEAVNLQAVVDGSTPLLFWFWAPH